MTLNDDAILALTATPPPATDFVLVLRPVRDPIERHNGFTRTPDYRLRLLLRAYGFRCVSCGPAVAPGAPNAAGGEVSANRRSPAKRSVRGFQSAAGRPPDSAIRFRPDAQTGYARRLPNRSS